ncbi:MAG: BMP family lipoprotein, partial [Spirochaetota bacterium]
LVVLLITFTAVLAFAGGQAEEGEQEEGITATMATDVGGLGDKSFNDSAYDGLEMAEEEFGANIDVIESNQMTDYVPNLSGLAEDGSDVVFAVGFLMEDAVKEVAANYPDTWFGGIDIGHNEGDPDNFIGIQYNEHEAGYLAGIVAGLMTKEYADRSDKLNDENVLGVVMGMLIPAVEKFEVGFIQGARYVNPDVEVISTVLDSFVDTAKGKEAANTMIERGADIIFAAAGNAGNGALYAADESDVLAIGVDKDQWDVAPGTILTSATKGVANSVYRVVKDVYEGNAEGGNVNYGIKENAVGLAPYHDLESIVPQAVKDEVQKAIDDIKAGERTIETTRSAIGR